MRTYLWLGSDWPLSLRLFLFAWRFVGGSRPVTAQDCSFVAFRLALICRAPLIAAIYRPLNSILRRMSWTRKLGSMSPQSLTPLWITGLARFRVDG